MTKKTGRKVGYKHGYRIVIHNGFYEVIDGNKAVSYGRCSSDSTVQEIADRTILKENRRDKDGRWRLLH